MACRPVSFRVNSVRNDDAALLDRAEPAAVDTATEDAPSIPEQESLF